MFTKELINILSYPYSNTLDFSKIAFQEQLDENANFAIKGAFYKISFDNIKVQGPVIRYRDGPSIRYRWGLPIRYNGPNFPGL